MSSRKRKRNTSDVVLDIFVYVFLTVTTIIIIFPVIYIIAGSFASAKEMTLNRFLLFPREPNLDAYRYILSTDTFPRSMAVTIFITVAGTLVNLVMTSLMAYPLSRKDLVGRRYLMYMVTVTLVFGGGMIPTYLVVNAVGLINTYSSLIIPGAISSFNLILIKNFFERIPESLIDSAKIDGCNDVWVLWNIVLPLSKPALATFTLFYAVGHWNTFLPALLYLNDPKKWTVQVLLRQIVILAQSGIGDDSLLGEQFVKPTQSVKMAVIVASTLPIMLVYPFLQKYFTKGVMVGSIKG